MTVNSLMNELRIVGVLKKIAHGSKVLVYGPRDGKSLYVAAGGIQHVGRRREQKSRDITLRSHILYFSNVLSLPRLYKMLSCQSILQSLL